MAMENVHNETYSVLLDTLIKDPNEKTYLLNAITTIPSIKKISDWALEWIDSDKSIGHRIIAFACIEAIFFSGAFAIIFWLKKYEGNGKTFMPGLVKSNEFISRDEGLHSDFACELYKLIINKLSEKDVHHIIRDSVEIANNFNNESIKCKLIGLNVNLMNQYIEYIADRLAVSLGYSKIYKTQNPFTFMDTIGMMQKTNFHDQRATEYQSAHINFESKNIIISSNDDF
jgi:ribonucleoside-diphosphate reductase beta chain